MENKIYAGCDIGTNTILMVVAKVFPDGSFKVFRDVQKIARLGEGLQNTGKISDQAINRAKAILFDCSKICRNLQVEKMFIGATAALREAENGDIVLKLLKKAIQNEIEILSGELEGRLSFLGTIEDDEKSIVIDVGGGSTEIICGVTDMILFQKSLPLGAVKITESILKENPPKQENIEKAIEYIQKELEIIPAHIS